MTVRLYALAKFALAFSKEICLCLFQSANLEQAQIMFMCGVPTNLLRSLRKPLESLL